MSENKKFLIISVNLNPKCQVPNPKIAFYQNTLLKVKHKCILLGIFNLQQYPLREVRPHAETAEGLGQVGVPYRTIRRTLIQTDESGTGIAAREGTHNARVLTKYSPYSRLHTITTESRIPTDNESIGLYQTKIKKLNKKASRNTLVGSLPTRVHVKLSIDR